jgi:flagellar hook-basal body complex protein FliE
MTAFPALRAAQAVSAYNSTEAGFTQAQPSQPGGADFGTLLTNSLNAAIGTNETAENKALNAIAGQGDLTQVVTAVSRAELALQTTVAIRDRVLQAYQDIIKMSI